MTNKNKFFYGESMPYVHFDKNGMTIKNGDNDFFNANIEKSSDQNGLNANNKELKESEMEERSKNVVPLLINIKPIKEDNIESREKENQSLGEEVEHEYNYNDEIPTEKPHKVKEIEKEEELEKNAELIEHEAKTVDQIEVEKVDKYFKISGTKKN